MAPTAVIRWYPKILGLHPQTQTKGGEID